MESPDTTGKVGKIGSSKHHRVTSPLRPLIPRGGEEKETSSKPATESHLDIMDSKHFTLKGANFVLKVGVIDGKVKGYMRGRRQTHCRD